MADVVDIIKIIYKELFTVRLLHTGYGTPRPDSIADNITLHPDASTKIIFSNYSIGYSFFNDTLVVFMRCADQSPVVPYIKFAENFRIRFLLNVSDDFLKKTVADPVGATQVYQFSNQANAGSGGFISMHTTGVNSDDLKTATLINADENCFGVIDIYSSAAINSAYELFSGANDHLNSPAYSLQFISKI